MTILSTAAKAAIAAGGLALGATAASAATLVFTPGAGNLTPGQSNYADFDTTFGNTGNVTGTSQTYTTGVFQTSVPGIAAEPGSGDQGDAFYAVLGKGSTTFSFAQAAGMFGFDLGSADTYNSITLNFVSGATQTFSGAELTNGTANGNQIIGATNGRVTIDSMNDRITSVTFNSTGNSFEFDNLGIGAVPEPSVWAMLILGFGVIGSTLRRRTVRAGAARAALA